MQPVQVCICDCGEASTVPLGSARECLSCGSTITPVDTETTPGATAGGIGGCSCRPVCACASMRLALEAIGWSRHSGAPRFGPKAQIARWGLGQEAWPTDWEMEEPGPEPGPPFPTPA